MSAMIQFPLDLPDVEVLKTELTAAGHLLVTVESTLEGTRCRRCGQEIREPHGHDRVLRLRHLPILEHPVYIEIRPKRYRCPYCSDHPTTTQRCTWYEPNSSHTRAFEQHALRSLINSTVTDVSRKLGLSAGAVEGILNRQVAQTVDWTSLKALGVLGLDEIALRKGHRDFVTMRRALGPRTGNSLSWQCWLIAARRPCRASWPLFLSGSKPPLRGFAPTCTTGSSMPPVKCCPAPAW
jgi:transposase